VGQLGKALGVRVEFDDANIAKLDDRADGASPKQ
jgi:hypothetical protein